MEVFFIFSTSGIAVRKALADTDGSEIVNGPLLNVVSCTLKPLSD